VAWGSVRFSFILVIDLLVRALDFAQLGDSVSDTPGKLLDGFDAAAGGGAQFLAQQKLRLPDHARQWVIDFMSNVCDQVSDLRQPRFMLDDQSTQLLLCQVGLLGMFVVCAHLLITSLPIVC
jgi:hypothetical protein